ncbi:hypothetical protein [uncultured Adlercreutzia sp.]|nr:hypothetical protein [uncultured Adlercreutzia sp.]
MTPSSFSLEVLLGTPAADYGSTFDARGVSDQELDDQLGSLNN